MLVDSPQAATATTQPILLPNLVVWTPEIDLLADKVCRWIRMELPGAVVYGQQRNGKTKATEYLSAVLSEILGYSVAIRRYIVPEQEASKRMNERDFVQDVMKQSGCEFTGARDAAVLRHRCISHLSEYSTQHGTSRLVFIVDEAQNLHRTQYGYLIHLYNRLEAVGIQVFCLLVGQPELKNAPSSWAEADGMQVLGRFLSREHYYRGIAVADIALVLEAFDEPGNAGDPSPLAGSFPNEYGEGWRLKQLAPGYEEAMNIIINKLKVAELRLPMQYLRASLLSLLHRVREKELALQQVQAAAVLAALKEAEFFGVASFYAKAKPKAAAQEAAALAETVA